MAGRMQLGEKATEAMAGRIDAAPGQDHAKSIICAICDTPAFESTVKAAGCGHLFDKGCLVEWLQGKDGDRRTCPVCRTVLPPGDAAYTEAEHFVREIIAGIKVDCPQDCAAPNPKRMRYEQLAGHIRACPLTPMLCGHTDCEEVVPQKDIKAHSAQCEHRAVSCSLCSEKVKKGVMQEHKASECPRRRYECAYCQKKTLIYSNKEAHERNDCTGQVPIGWVADLRQQNRELKEEVQELRNGHAEEIKKVREGHVKEIKKVQQLLLASLCPRITVVSKERAWLSGEYTITPEQVNGCRVWARAPGYYVFKGTPGFWIVTSERGSMAKDAGNLSSAEKSDSPYPVGVSGWRWAPDQKWVPAPGTTVTAMTAL
eukprot:TRINITY_DN2541_c0_g1_i3.p1 TRINITY_DN2541_c0_g1~~TRINITY_DN2541_c0_g1_i3.p1  ORF type:complete len:395 (+),score=121.97 TRINITY_DN2541_c0_g1_i3:73-1185(+)